MFCQKSCRDDVEVGFDPYKYETLKPILSWPRYTQQILEEKEVDEKRTLGFQILILEILQKNGSAPHRVNLNGKEVEEVVKHLGLSWNNVMYWELVPPKSGPGIDTWELRLHLHDKFYPLAWVSDCLIPIFRRPVDFHTLPRWRQNMAMRVPWLYLHLSHFQTNNLVTYQCLYLPEFLRFNAACP